MNKFTEKDIIDIAKLAKLQINPADLQKRVEEFNEILVHIEKLNEVKDAAAIAEQNTSKLEMFDDVPRPSAPIEDVLKNAPNAEKPFFYIPRVIEGGKS